MNIVLDTQVLIYAVEDAKRPNAEELHRKARHYVRTMSKEGHNLILPAIVVGEFLVAHKFENDFDALRTLTKHFMVIPFDVKTAQIFGPIYKEKGLAMAKEKCESKSCRKRKISADCQVVATTIACNGDVLVSNDPDLKRLGDGRVNVIEVPSIPEQLKLAPGMS